MHADNTDMPSLMQWLDINQVVPSDVRLQTWLAFAFLAICLFNTIGLLLAKFLRRAGEIGVRRALGASRAAVFAQCLVEAGTDRPARWAGRSAADLAGPVADTPPAGRVRRSGASGSAMFLVTFACDRRQPAGRVTAGAARQPHTPAIQLKTL